MLNYISMKDILLLIAGAILGVLGQWIFYRYQKRDEQKQGPMIVVSKMERDDNVWIELRNVGQDTLTELSVKISWEEHHQHKEMLVTQFRRNGEQQTSAVDVIGVSEILHGQGAPITTDDGIIDVQVSGLGVKSRRLYSDVTQIAVTIHPA